MDANRVLPSFHLWKACKNNDLVLLRQALELGEDVNAMDCCGQTSLHYAVRFESLDVLQFLVNLPNIKMFDEQYKSSTPLHFVVKNRRFHYEAMMKMGKIIMEKATDLYFEKTSILIDVLYLYKKIPNSLHNEWLNFACMFLYYGANVYTFDKKLRNAITFSIKLNCNSFVSVILPYIADFNMKVYSAYVNKTIFFLAIEHNSPHVFYMIENGADVNFGNEFNTCLKLSTKHSKKLFVYIFTHCTDEVILSERNLIADFLRYNRFNTDDFLYCLNTMFESELILPLLNYTPAEHIHIKFMSAFSRRKIPIDEQIKMLYSVLMYNNTISLTELYEIYKMCKRVEQVELFEIFMRITVSVVKFRKGHLNASTMFKCLCFPNRFVPKPITTFPTLLALSRNCVRRNIRSDLIHDKNHVLFKYYNCLLQLKLPEMLIDILTLKKLV